MATFTYSTGQNSSSSSQRGIAMVLALVSAVVLSPLYLNNHSHHRKMGSSRFYETHWISSGFVLPMVLAGLIVAIRTTSSSSNSLHCGGGSTLFPSLDQSWVLRIGSSSWGLAGILVMLVLVLSWQESAQEFFWR